MMVEKSYAVKLDEEEQKELDRIINEFCRCKNYINIYSFINDKLTEVYEMGRKDSEGQYYD